MKNAVRLWGISRIFDSLLGEVHSVITHYSNNLHEVILLQCESPSLLARVCVEAYVIDQGHGNWRRLLHGSTV